MFLTPGQLINELNLKDGDKVLEVGSGSGAWTLELAKKVSPTGQIYALDIHRDMLHTLADNLSRQGILNVDIIWADIEKETKLDAYSLDGAVLANVMFQIDNKEKAIANVAKTLKPDGLLLLVDWSSSFSGIGPKEDHVFDEEMAEKMLIKNNFRIVKRLPAGKYHYALMARA